MHRFSVIYAWLQVAVCILTVYFYAALKGQDQEIHLRRGRDGRI